MRALLNYFFGRQPSVADLDQVIFSCTDLDHMIFSLGLNLQLKVDGQKIVYI